MLQNTLWVATLLAIYVALPVLLIWGWVRCAHDTIPRTMSFMGFSLARVSALLALFAVLYARLIHSFPYYDPTLMRIYGFGCLLS